MFAESNSKINKQIRLIPKWAKDSKRHFSKEEIASSAREEHELTDHEGSAHQRRKYLPAPSRRATVKTQKTASVAEDAEKLEPLCTVGGNVK